MSSSVADKIRNGMVTNHLREMILIIDGVHINTKHKFTGYTRKDGINKIKLEYNGKVTLLPFSEEMFVEIKHYLINKMALSVTESVFK